ncbi:MAG TPA: hypothetical protein VF452_13735 [Candidatus Binatia bacterium]
MKKQEENLLPVKKIFPRTKKNGEEDFFFSKSWSSTQAAHSLFTAYSQENR